MLLITDPVIGNYAYLGIFLLLSFLIGFVWLNNRSIQIINIKSTAGKRLVQMPHYPVRVDSKGRPYIDYALFMEKVHYFLKHKRRDLVAAQELIYLGERNDIQTQFQDDPDPDRLNQYLKLRKKYSGVKRYWKEEILFSNYISLANGLGKHYKGTGTEIVLHNLLNPMESILTVANSVTGRIAGDSATNLALRLIRQYSKGKGRKKMTNKCAYEVQIESRRFKCTTIPIYHDKWGLIGLFCINFDLNYFTEAVLKDSGEFQKYVNKKTKVESCEFEMMLSPKELELAQKGKRHWKDKDF